MESIIRAKMEEYLCKNNLLTKEQHSFVRNKSCTTNLLETLDFISSSLDASIPVNLILLDFAKVFNHGLLYNTAGFVALNAKN